MSPQVKLVCGERRVRMAFTSMKDLINFAAERLECSNEEVILQYEEDSEKWEIADETTLKELIESNTLIHASRIKPTTKRSRVADPSSSKSQRTPPRLSRTPPASPRRSSNASSTDEGEQRGRREKEEEHNGGCGSTLSCTRWPSREKELNGS